MTPQEVSARAALHPAALALCRFYIRSPVEGGQFRYEQISLASSQMDCRLRTAHPPLPGDLIFLWDSYKKEGGMFRVIERAWHHAGWGSMVWPYTEMLPTEGPGADIIVEPAEGLFRDEAPIPDEDES